MRNIQSRNRKFFSNLWKICLCISMLWFPCKNYANESSPISASSSLERTDSVIKSENWIQTWQIAVGRGIGFYRVPSELSIRRSFQDAWASDGLFVPEYYRAIPFFPKYTGFTTETTNASFRIETDIWSLFYLGFGLGFRQYEPTSSTRSAVQNRNLFQSQIFQDMIPLNQLRIFALTSVTILALKSEYWLYTSGRMPFWFWETSWFRPYAEIGFGAGGCVGGESCNLTVYSGGLGIEFMREKWLAVPYMDFGISRMSQHRIRRTIGIEESSVYLGIRYYR